MENWWVISGKLVEIITSNSAFGHNFFRNRYKFTYSISKKGAMTDVDKLFDRIDKFRYPATMIQVKNEIRGLAFFPAGTGTFSGDKNLSDKNIMILGQDFDCETTYQNVTLKAEREDTQKNPTWRNLLKFLKSVDVLPTECFFTNAIMGIRKGNRGIGKSPAFKDKEFIENCREFFLYQLKIMEPNAIFVLGPRVGEFLSSTSKDLICWKSIPNFTTIDKTRTQTISATFNNGIKSKLVLLTHPSMRPPNVKRRTYQKESGDKAEIRMVQSILK